MSLSITLLHKDAISFERKILDQDLGLTAEGKLNPTRGHARISFESVDEGIAVLMRKRV
jgi:hypothetical protein